MQIDKPIWGLNVEKLAWISKIRNHDTCQISNLYFQFCGTSVLKRGVINTEIKLFNDLPNQVRKFEKNMAI
jgi:hypothetical protein